MEWSGRAPAPPAIEAGEGGAKDKLKAIIIWIVAMHARLPSWVKLYRLTTSRQVRFASDRYRIAVSRRTSKRARSRHRRFNPYSAHHH